MKNSVVATACIAVIYLAVISQGQHISTSGCASSKGCLRWPNTCNTSMDCLALVTFRVNPVTNNSVIIELSGRTNGWVAFGLNDGERKMGGTRGHVCMMRSGSVQLRGFENDGTDSDIRDLVANVTLLSAQSLNGSLICSYERPVAGVGYLRSLTSKWHLVGSWGPGIEEEGSKLELKEHGPGDVFWTRDTQDLRVLASNHASTYRYKVILAHAACMILAWVFFSSFGMFFARYTRIDMDRKEMFGQKLWFLTHRIFMTLTFLLTIAGIILIFTEVRNWSTEGGAHPYTGTYTTLLVIWQPLSATFRPALDHPRRKWFEWGHWVSAIIAIILSVVTMYLGLSLLEVESYVLTIFVAGAGGIILLIEIVRIVSTRRATQVKKEDDPNTLQIEQKKLPDKILPKLRMWGMPIVAILAGTVAVILIYDVHKKVDPYIQRA